MKTTLEILKAAKAATIELSSLKSEEKNAALLAMADALEENADEILSANCQDVENAKNTLSPVMIDRLRLDKKRIAAMAQGIREVVSLPDPVGAILEQNTLPNGLLVTKKKSTPGGNRHHLRKPPQRYLGRRRALL